MAGNCITPICFWNNCSLCFPTLSLMNYAEVENDFDGTVWSRGNPEGLYLGGAWFQPQLGQ